jgi:hypothetical protein
MRREQDKRNKIFQVARKMWRQIDRTEKDQSSTKGMALETQSIGPLSDLSRLVWLDFCVAPKVGPRWALHFFRVLEAVLSPEGSHRMPDSVAPSSFFAWPFVALAVAPRPLQSACVVCCVVCVVCCVLYAFWSFITSVWGMACSC